LQTTDLTRQLNIHQDQIELLTAQLDQRNLALSIGYDIMLSHPGNTFHEGEVRCIIFDVSNTHLGFPYTSLHSRALSSGLPITLAAGLVLAHTRVA
jgi:hypothetical protein